MAGGNQDPGGYDYHYPEDDVAMDEYEDWFGDGDVVTLAPVSSSGVEEEPQEEYDPNWWQEYIESFDANWGQDLLDNQTFGDPSQSDVFNLTNQAQIDLAAANKLLADAQAAAAKAKADADAAAAKKTTTTTQPKNTSPVAGGSGGGGGLNLGPKNPNPAAPAQSTNTALDSILKSVFGNPQTGQKGLLSTILGVTPIAAPATTTRTPNTGPITTLPPVSSQGTEPNPLLVPLALGAATLLGRALFR